MSKAANDFKRTQIKGTAFKTGWRLIHHNETKEILQYRRNNVFTDIHIRSMRIVTLMRHEKEYKILMREGVGLVDIQNLLQNPRTHTGKGKFI